MIHAFTALAALATASLTTAAPLDGTHAGEVAGRFWNTTSTVARERVTGWTAGRCYRVDVPNTPIGTALVFETRDKAPGADGPIFDHPVTKMFVAEHAKGVEQPDLFDNPSPELAAMLSTYVDGVFVNNDFSETFAGDDHTTSATYGFARYDLRTDETYSYVRLSDWRNNFDLAYCYFFKKVR